MVAYGPVSMLYHFHVGTKRNRNGQDLIKYSPEVSNKIYYIFLFNFKCHGCFVEMGDGGIWPKSVLYQSLVTFVPQAVNVVPNEWKPRQEKKTRMKRKFVDPLIALKCVEFCFNLIPCLPSLQPSSYQIKPFLPPSLFVRHIKLTTLASNHNR